MIESRDLVQATQIALRHLARREHTEQELTAKLSTSFDNEIVDETVNLLREKGEVCDKRFAEMLVRSRFNRGFGPIYIAKELRSKGVDPDIGKECLFEFDGQWHQKAKELLEKKRIQRQQFLNYEYRDNEALIKSKALEDKLMRFLFGRGFPSDIVYKLF